MSRSGYVDDCENLNLYRATVERTIKGKRGQKFLRELADAMDRMPEKKLIAHELVAESGEMCTIGVFCVAKNIDVSNVDVEDPESVGKAVDIARQLAAEIEFENDEAGPCNETPEQRWTRMRQWVRESLA